MAPRLATQQGKDLSSKSTTTWDAYWVQEGMLPYFRTLGGHRRYPYREIRALLETLSEPSPAGALPRLAGRPPGPLCPWLGGRLGSSSA